MQAAVWGTDRHYCGALKTGAVNAEAQPGSEDNVVAQFVALQAFGLAARALRRAQCGDNGHDPSLAVTAEVFNTHLRWLLQEWC